MENSANSRRSATTTSTDRSQGTLDRCWANWTHAAHPAAHGAGKPTPNMLSVKNLSGGVLAWLNVWSKVQIVCIPKSNSEN